MELTPLAQTLVGPVREILQEIDDLLSSRPQFNPECDEITLETFGRGRAPRIHADLVIRNGSQFDGI